MKTFNGALTEARSTKSNIDEFFTLFQKYDFFSDLKNVKKSINNISFELNETKTKITIQFDEIEINYGGKVVKTIQFDSVVGQDEADSVVDKLVSLK